jgi:predicted metal-dependent hydrolase
LFRGFIHDNGMGFFERREERRKVAASGRTRIRVRSAALQLEDRIVEVKVRLNPRAHRVIVKVHPVNGEVTVTVPSERALAGAIAFAEDEAAWIARKLARVPERTVFRPGIRIPFRGVDHLIVHDDGGRLPVWIEEQTATIHVGGKIEHAPRRLLDFLKREARRALAERTEVYAGILGVRPSRIGVRDTESRWGSCSPSRRLSFSWRLILAPPFVLDYVAAHETAHLRAMNHGPAFWKLVRSLVDDTDAPRRWLNRNGAALHRYIA